MSDAQPQKVTIKTMLMIILAAIVTAVVVTLLQVLILKESHPAITGGVVGAVIAVFAIRVMRKSAVTPR